MKNNKGFTLIEVIAVITIIGILAVLVIPQIFGLIERSRKKMYVEDAIKLISKAQYVMNAKSSQINKPRNGEVIILSLDYLGTREFENAPNGGTYLKYYSYVAVVNKGGKFHYSAMLVEKLKRNGYMGVELISEKDLNTAKATEHVKSFDAAEIQYVEDTPVDKKVYNDSSDATKKLLSISYIKSKLGEADSGVWSSVTSSEIAESY